MESGDLINFAPLTPILIFLVLLRAFKQLQICWLNPAHMHEFAVTEVLCCDEPFCTHDIHGVFLYFTHHSSQHRFSWDATC